MDSEQRSGGEQSLKTILKKATNEIIHIRTMFPFTIFPTEIVVDEIKVTIVTHGLMTKYYFPIHLRDIKTVTVFTDLFFGSLRFEISGYEQNPGLVKFLKKDEAIKAHQILVGLTAVLKEKAEKSIVDVPEDELQYHLIDIGGSSIEPDKKETDVKHP